MSNVSTNLMKKCVFWSSRRRSKGRKFLNNSTQDLSLPARRSVNTVKKERE